jgi:alkylation response protein AidB-like acyl-CoA dehydrogenase
MVDFGPEQKALQARAREVARGAIAARAAEVDRTEEYPWENVRLLKEAGLMGMTIPSAYDGKGLGFLEAVLAIEQMAQVCGVPPASSSRRTWARSARSCATAARCRSGSRQARSGSASN